MRRFALLLYVFFFLGGNAHAEERGVHRVMLQATAQDGEPLALYKESHALLIGVSEYTQWPRLDSIPAELDQVEQALIAQDFNVIRLRDPKGRELSNGIEDFINEYGYERENRLLIYFSGHGHSIGDKGFLVPADTPLPEDKGFRRETVPMSRVLSWARDMEAKHALFLFDSCFSGSVFKSRNLPKANDRYIRQATAEPVRQFITAGGADQEVPAKSTFTPALVRAINGEGDLNKDGYITGSELGVHLSQLVPRFVDQTPQYGKIKDFDLAQGDFVFFKQKAQQISQVASVPDQSLDALFWQSAERGNTVEEYQAYVERYPNGTFTRLAETRIKRIEQSQVIVVDPIEEEPSLPVVNTTGKLTIRVDPPDARVRIMNIVPRYRDGIELELRKSYDVLVTQDGYKSDRREVRLTEKNQIENIALKSLVSLGVDQNIDEIKLSSSESEGILENAISAQSHPPSDQKGSNRAIQLHKLCNKGKAGSCNVLGDMYQFGSGVKKDVNRAVALYQQGCDGGVALGCTTLGGIYEHGSGVKKDVSRAVTLYEQGCDGGDALGCTKLGVKYEKGSSVQKDTSRAVTLYQQGCDGGVALGCTILGSIYYEGIGIEKDVNRAVVLYEQGCDGGAALGCTTLGSIYQYGSGVKKDVSRAVTLYQRGCDGGDAHGCTLVGFMYEKGSGVQKDVSRALALYEQGCDGGVALGCTSLGFLYENGSGVQKDVSHALTLYEQGCDGGDALGCQQEMKLR